MILNKYIKNIYKEKIKKIRKKHTERIKKHVERKKRLLQSKGIKTKRIKTVHYPNRFYKYIKEYIENTLLSLPIYSLMLMHRHFFPNKTLKLQLSNPHEKTLIMKLILDEIKVCEHIKKLNKKVISQTRRQEKIEAKQAYTYINKKKLNKMKLLGMKSEHKKAAQKIRSKIKEYRIIPSFIKYRYPHRTKIK